MSAFFTRIGSQILNSILYSVKTRKRSCFRKKIKELLVNFLRYNKVVLQIILVSLCNSYLLPLFFVSLFYLLYCSVVVVKFIYENLVL